ncbi:MAG: hypothetical protein ACLP4V_27945, partial [Methylocella sp.]
MRQNKVMETMNDRLPVQGLYKRESHLGANRIPKMQRRSTHFHRGYLPILIRSHSRAIVFCVAKSCLPGAKSR